MRLILPRFAGALLLAALVVPDTHAETAAEFPSKPVTLICPWPAGGPTDVVLRAMAEVAAKKLGQPIVVDNRAGASGTLGPATMAATAKPDGYTISQMVIPMFRLPSMQKVTFDPVRDFTYIMQLTGYVFGVSARGDSRFKSWADVVAYAKANPGKLNYASTGTGGTLHIGMEQVARASGVAFNHVPFKGEAEALTALLGGHVDLMAAGTGRQELIDANQIVILNIWGETRSKRLPAVPTLRELGMPFVFDSPWGIAGPKGMDALVVAKLHDAFKAAIDDPGVQAAMLKWEMVPKYLGTADYTRRVPDMIAEERAHLERVGLLKKD